LEVLYPDRDVSRLNQNIANEGCVVARLVYGEVSMLLTCDMSAEMEGRVLELEGGELESDILKVAHHGSKYSSTDAFVAAVAPAFAAISVGARNTYGHPGESTLDTLAAHGAKVLRTDQEGTIVFKSDGSQVWMEQK
jgi:beta-lactamase superfamily II metal-dependent hydrolase